MGKILRQQIINKANFRGIFAEVDLPVIQQNYAVILHFIEMVEIGRLDIFEVGR